MSDLEREVREALDAACPAGSTHSMVQADQIVSAVVALIEAKIESTCRGGQSHDAVIAGYKAAVKRAVRAEAEADDLRRELSSILESLVVSKATALQQLDEETEIDFTNLDKKDISELRNERANRDVAVVEARKAALLEAANSDDLDPVTHGRWFASWLRARADAQGEQE